MAEIVLFHSVLGLNSGVTAAADRLRQAGHVVHTPNLYEAATVFDDYPTAMKHVESFGYPRVTETHARCRGDSSC